MIYIEISSSNYDISMINEMAPKLCICIKHVLELRPAYANTLSLFGRIRVIEGHMISADGFYKISIVP